MELKPWGSYTNILDEEYTKVKKIVIKSGESPSYQYHFKRSEIWVIVKGSAEVKIDDNIMTCLLYTSPSPRDQRGYRMPSSA